jgi:hypothetical protein
MFGSTLRSFLVLFLTTCASSLHADAAEPNPTPRVTVVFKNGRRTNAAIDSRTDSHRLWLRFGSETAHITRTFDWEEVELFRLSGEALSRADALSWAQQTAPDPAIRNATILRKSILPSVHVSGDAVDGRQPPIPDERTRYVRFDAGISNWDNDVEMDGLLLQVSPFSSSGQPTAIRGQLNVELWAMRRIDQDSAPHGRGRSLEVLQRWFVPVTTDAAGPGNWLKLPFQARHPEFDTNWSSIGLVHVQLVAPGHGVFHHSIDAVRIRPYAPFRDAVQFQTGERFLPTELNGRK